MACPVPPGAPCSSPRTSLACLAQGARLPARSCLAPPLQGLQQGSSRPHPPLLLARRGARSRWHGSRRWPRLVQARRPGRRPVPAAWQAGPRLWCLAAQGSPTGRSSTRLPCRCPSSLLRSRQGQSPSGGATPRSCPWPPARHRPWQTLLLCLCSGTITSSWAGRWHSRLLRSLRSQMGHPRRLQHCRRRSAPLTWGMPFRWTLSCWQQEGEVRHSLRRSCLHLCFLYCACQWDCQQQEGKLRLGGRCSSLRSPNVGMPVGLLACSALLKGLHVSTFLGRACLDFCMSVRPEDGWPAPQLLVSPYQVHLKGAAVQTHQRLCQLNAGWSSALALFVMVLPPSMPCLLLPHTSGCDPGCREEQAGQGKVGQGGPQEEAR